MKTVPALLMLIVACLTPLALGIETILLIELPGGLPFGTLLAAMAMMSASSIPVIQSKPETRFRLIAWVLLLASVLWLPLGIVLSGNAALSFVQDAADAQFFWRFTAGLSSIVLVTLIGSGIQLFLARRTEQKRV